jgi:hypothetical protein
MRYGQGDPSSDKDSLVTPADFTDYMCAALDGT